jgi:uncharacterized protein (DUF2236 family)
MKSMLSIVYGSRAQASAAAGRINHVHARVHGVSDDGPYDATDPGLLLWVHATLVDTTLTAVRTFGTKPPRPFLCRYYDETRVAAGLLGVPSGLLPDDLSAFEAYWKATLTSREITVSPTAMELATTILAPPLPSPLRPISALAVTLTTGMLPEKLRRQYRLPWGHDQAAIFSAAKRCLAGLAPLTSPLRTAALSSSGLRRAMLAFVD